MRLIDADRLKDILEYGILCNVPNDAVNTKEEKWNDWVQEIVDKAPTAEAIPKADYNARLKADMVAMLEDIKEQLREMHEDFFETEHFDEAYGVSNSMDVIQQKINALRG